MKIFRLKLTILNFCVQKNLTRENFLTFFNIFLKIFNWIFLTPPLASNPLSLSLYLLLYGFSIQFTQNCPLEKKS